jgi:hypothetical protein
MGAHSDNDMQIVRHTSSVFFVCLIQPCVVLLVLPVNVTLELMKIQ